MRNKNLYVFIQVFYLHHLQLLLHATTLAIILCPRTNPFNQF